MRCEITDDGKTAEMLEDAADEIERLRNVEEDHKNVLKAALYNEPNGIDLVKRLTYFAISNRNPSA